MARYRTSANRPLSPHLQVYRLTITMAMSVMHRITGAALYVGTVLLAWWLVAAASNEHYFNFVNQLFATYIGRLILLGYTWALFHHMLGGIRHLIWDTGLGLGKNAIDKFAWLTLILSLALTLATWMLGYWVRGF
jgi:succinate dehydrogenase / fumarate reductase cytochrome b subunit